MQRAMQCATVRHDISLSDVSLQAALLHDTLEDTDTSYKELSEEFSEDVAGMCCGDGGKFCLNILSTVALDSSEAANVIS